jgi:hypothetical protein
MSARQYRGSLSNQENVIDGGDGGDGDDEEMMDVPLIAHIRLIDGSDSVQGDGRQSCVAHTPLAHHYTGSARGVRGSTGAARGRDSAVCHRLTGSTNEGM